MSRSPVGRPLFAVLALATLACGGEPEPPRPVPPSRFTVLPEPGATTLAVAVVVPGSAWEDEGTSGLTLLAARTLIEAALPRLRELGAVADVSCDLAAFTFTLVAPPDRWADALTIFLAALFRPAPDEPALERARSWLAASLRLDRANPAWQARLAARQALWGDDEVATGAWGRPACGLTETLPFFDLRYVAAAAHRFDARRATAALAGPIPPVEAEAILSRHLAPGPLPPFPAPDPPRGGRRYVERNTVTAWLAIAFPFGETADVEAIRLLGAVLRDAIEPGLERPEVFDAGYHVDRHGAGGALVVHAVMAPEAVSRHAALLEDRVAEIAARGVNPAVRERVMRRHRGLRLAELSAPEARMAELARALALPPRRPEPWPALDRLDAAAVREAAAGLGPSARAVVGPRAARGAGVP